MSETWGWLTAYSALVIVLSLAGGYLPFLGKVSHSRLQLYLSLSAGVMLGAAFFHIMPEAWHHSGKYFGWWMSLGVVGLFAIERFIAPHSHEIDGGGHEHHQGNHDHSHHHASGEHRAAAPAVAGWMAVFGLTLHTFMNGVGLAGAVSIALDPGHAKTAQAWLLGLPGGAMFLAIFLHKPADALAISVVLSRKGVSRWKIFLVQVGFVLMVPIGALAFIFTAGNIEESLHDQLTGAALAISAGTFLFIALSDLLPEVQFHRHDRVPLFLALFFGIIFMGGIGALEEHGGTHSHGGHDNGHDHSHPHDH